MIAAMRKIFFAPLISNGDSLTNSYVHMSRRIHRYYEKLESRLIVIVTDLFKIRTSKTS